MRSRFWIALVTLGLAGSAGAQLPEPAAFQLRAPEPPTAATTPASLASSSSSDNSDAYTFRKSVNEVNLIFTVLDKHGKPVRDLNRSDIEVLDNYRPPDAITQFQASTNMPLRIGILVDVSGSIRSRFHFEQESAIDFLRNVIRPQTDKAFLLRFHSGTELAQDFTGDTDQLARAVRSLRAGGGTAIYDAIYRACHDELIGVDNGSANVHRAIVLISDGEDNQSRHGREEALELAMRSNVTIYAISTNTSGVVTHGDKVLERFAQMTGGRVYYPSKASELSGAFNSIEQELRSQYFLAYRPADLAADGRYHRIEVDIARNHNYQVRARQGYYAPRN